MAELRRVLAPDGVLAIVGGEGGNPWTGGFVERLLGATARSLFSTQKLRSVNATIDVPSLQALKALAEAGQLTPVLDRRYRLEDAVDALQALERGHARGKSVVVPDVDVH